MKDSYEFVAVFEYAEDGISISFPDLPGCLSCATTTEEAIKNSEEVLGLVLYDMEQEKEKLTKPTPFEKIKCKSNEKAILINVWMPLVRNELDEQSVKKTLTIPQWLNKLAEKENINFSDKADGKLGGPTCLEATAYTVGGMVAQTAAINLKLHNSGSMFGNFLPNLTTMGDILNKEGYQQVFLCGSEGDFAGRDTYFTSHKDFHIEDYNAAKKEGFIAPDYKVFWGHEDEILYKRAKKQLEQLSSSDKPFNLTMLTVDTHFPRGYKCRLCKDKYNRQYANVIACADQQVYDFVEWIKKQDFYKNTTIVIAGDHTTMVDTSDPIWGNLNNNYKRTVYNTIINADCTYKENVTENRDFSTMDMFPTTLAALGVQIDGNRLGLGTNLFSGQKTLPEKLGRGYINQELKKNDKEYNGFYKLLSGQQGSRPLGLNYGFFLS